MEEEKKNHGGKRENSGRKSIPTNMKKQIFSLALPPWLIEWMDKQSKSRARLIEVALKNHWEISDPSFLGDRKEKS